MKYQLILDYQNRKKEIIVPRSVPLVPNPVPQPKPTPPTPNIPKKPEVISEEDELIIPVQNRDPGVIKADDEKIIRKIVDDNKVCKDKAPINNLPIIPKPGYIDLPKYNNFTKLIDA